MLFLLYSIKILSQTIESDLTSISGYYYSKAEIVNEANTLFPKLKLASKFNIIPISLNMNTKDKQIDVRNSYVIPLNEKSPSKTKDFDINIGYSLGGKMDNSFQSIFKDNNVVGGYKIGGLFSLRMSQSSQVFDTTDLQNLMVSLQQVPIGSKEEKSLKKEIIKTVSEKLRNNDYWVYAAPQFEGRNFVNIDSLNSFNFNRKKSTISKWKFGISTFQNDLPLKMMGLANLSFSINNDDNFSSLDEVSSSRQYSNTSASNKESFTSFSGAYIKNTKSKNISFETYLVNKNFSHIGIYINPLYNFDHSLYKPAIDINYTIYFLDSKNSVLQPNFGIAFSHKDIFKNRDELFENKSRFSIGVVTRLNIGDWFN